MLCNSSTVVTGRPTRFVSGVSLDGDQPKTLYIATYASRSEPFLGYFLSSRVVSLSAVVMRNFGQSRGTMHLCRGQVSVQLPGTQK